MERQQAPIYGNSGIPPELLQALPWWIRYHNLLWITPLSVAAVIALMFEAFVVAGVLLLAAMAVHLGFFWVAKAWLNRRGRWQRGTSHAEELPLIYTLRGLLGLLLAVAVAGGYLLLARKLRSQPLLIATIASVATVPLVYVWLSLAQGFVGSHRGNIDFQSENPVRFWLGLATYTLLMVIGAVIVIWVLVTHGT